MPPLPPVAARCGAPEIPGVGPRIAKWRTLKKCDIQLFFKDMLESYMTVNFPADGPMAASMVCNLLPCCVYTTRKGVACNS